ncbi:hypothetical protein BSR29_05885 [Boudabousia liubingyangii]|uniref:Solute-binding protein family 5 domain-containing protein n=1 Tax=Boudabousia liubingyangii TaxID=1921764 RepID=A0A1Q5PLU1_9ACTO|nr:ABC transporter substrate-binding protein [Boudabousia liubingyangii]OKL48006.1 hypothetical protein BSR29_05885 [Boudabousia liubingyangii]
MKFNRFGTLVITPLLGVGLLSACSVTQSAQQEVAVPAGSQEVATSDSAGSAGQSVDPVTFSGCEPQTKLLPGLVDETCGVNVLSLTTSRLLAYDNDGKTYNELADSISTEDNQNWTVKIKSGQTFSDGSPINADSFINAWNLVVREKQVQAFFFENMQGYEPGKDLPGLKKVDDLTFTVALSQPESDWPQRLGYVTYAPLPEVAFKDLDAFGEQPVSSGPYTLTKWQHRESVSFAVNPKYVGPRKAENGGLESRMYTTPDAAYNDLLAGNLDVLTNIPDSALKSFKEDLDGRGVTKSIAGVLSVGISMDAPNFTGEEGRLRRAAISMAINRPEIIDTIFEGTKQPAEDFTSPAVDGWRSGVPGSEVLKFNPEKAKELWAQAEKINKFQGPFKIAYNTAGGNQAWVDAVCNQLKNNLGIQAEGDAYPDFKSVRDKISKGEMKTAYRANWTADYPSQYNFLGPLYGSQSDSNDAKYKNPQFDALLKSALGSKDPKEAAEKYAKAQEELLRDLPAIPLWYGSISGGYSDRVENVNFGWDDVPPLFAVKKK